MKVEIISHTPNPEMIIEIAGRTCYQSQAGNPAIIKNWIKAGHESVIEHASITFRLSGVTRAMTHQLVRHRLASYSQKSQRYVDENNFNYVMPIEIKRNEKAYKIFKNLMNDINTAYKKLRELDIKKEDARSVLPNATTTEIITTMNFRELRNFFNLRTSKHAQKEIRSVAIEMLFEAVKIAPNVFQDIVDNLEVR